VNTKFVIYEFLLILHLPLERPVMIVDEKWDELWCDYAAAKGIV
jgi:hypothetical protein